MADDKTKANQNLSDLVRVITVLTQILATKEINAVDEKRIDYCHKVIDNVIEKIPKKKKP